MSDQPADLALVIRHAREHVENMMEEIGDEVYAACDRLETPASVVDAPDLDAIKARYEAAYAPCDHLGSRACRDCRLDRLEGLCDTYMDDLIAALRAKPDLDALIPGEDQSVADPVARARKRADALGRLNQGLIEENDRLRAALRAKDAEIAFIWEQFNRLEKLSAEALKRTAEIRAPRSPADLETAFDAALVAGGRDPVWLSTPMRTFARRMFDAGAALRSGETTPDYHSCTDPACKRCEKRPGEYCQDDDCNCGLPGNHATLPVETTPTPEEDQACMGALRVVRLLENAKGIRRNVGIADALEQARLNLAALAQRTGWRQPE